MLDEMKFVPETFLAETECGHIVVDLYKNGPFYGRAISSRVEFISEYLTRPVETEMVDDVGYEFSILDEVAHTLSSMVGPEWESYIYVEEGDEDWFLEGFEAEGLEAPRRIGNVYIAGIEHSIWR